jgi:phospho-N-acetylmuramoyl-pentapeptide-transferase
MAESLTAFLISFLLGVLLSRTLRRSLSWLYSRERKPGKERIRRLFPKPRRPLGGGLAIMIAATTSSLLVPLAWGRLPTGDTVLVLVAAWSYAAIGLIDDLSKAAGRGLTERVKLLYQLLAAFVLGLALWAIAGRHDVAVPFVRDPVDFGLWYVLFAAFLFVATANAVNLSDGIDGLAGGAAVIALAGLAAIGYVEPSRSSLAVCWPLMGAGLGFLVFNFPPARLLMGDTGALGLGAAIAAMAAVGQVEFMLLLIGAPFVLNAASVVLQMGAVRGLWRVLRPLRHQRTETARPFLCAPLHHHFQWLSWPIGRILALYWGMAGLMSVWALLALHSDVVWLFGALVVPVILVLAAGQKLLIGNYFIGLADRADGSQTVAVYQGLPLWLLRWPLHRKLSDTNITESMLVGATAESILWRPLSEFEGHVVLGKVYSDHRLFDEALAEWEQVPTRNLLLRPSVVMRLARIYYGRDRLLEAIKLWEQVPGSRLSDMPNLREVVRSAKLRLADLASKSHRQAMRSLRNADRTGETPERVEAHLAAARRYNQELLSLLLYEQDKLRGRPADPAAVRARRQLLHRTRDAVMARIRELDVALAELARSTPPPPAGAESEAADADQRAAAELNVSLDGLLGLLARAGQGQPRITQAAVHPKASRNTVYRLGLSWPDGGPSTAIAKLYAADRISFFAACYQREEGVLRLLHDYGANVPQVYAGELREDQALLVMEDLGDETLAERLEASSAPVKEQWLRSGVTALASLHSTSHTHFEELSEEIGKVAKDRLGADYYFNALRIAVERISLLADEPVTDSDWQEMADQAGPLVDLLAERRRSIIHFESTPHHLVVTESGLYAFDFEQATVGPLEFDLAALLGQPESDLGTDYWEEMVEHYRILVSESRVPVPPPEELARGVAYATLLKCLVYAGAAANFLGKFGGEHHIHRLRYYLEKCDSLMGRWGPLRPLGRILAPRFGAAREVALVGGIGSRDGAPG